MIYLTGHVDEHLIALVPDSREAWSRALAIYAGKRVAVEVKRAVDSVRAQQHRYYRAVVLPAYTEALNEERRQSEVCELFPDQVHLLLKMRHDGCERDGEQWVPKRSMAAMSTAEAAAFIDAVREDAWQRWLLRIPHANEPMEAA